VIVVTYKWRCGKNEEFKMLKHVAYSYSNYYVFKGSPFRGQSYSYMDIVVGIATRCGLDGSNPGRTIFLDPYRPFPRLNHPVVQWVPGVVSRGKASEAWCLPSSPYSAEFE
jgi:hypothetical protein